MSSAQILGEPGVLRALGEASEWRLLGLLFERPRPGWSEQVLALASEVRDPQLRTAAHEALAEAGEGLYHSWFGPGGPAAPREVSHDERIEPGRMLSELGAYYQAFAYRPSTGEAPDHVAVEAGFVAYLRLKAAYALACGQQEQAALAEEAAEQFVADHLRVLVAPMAAALAGSEVGYLMRAAACLLQRVGTPEPRPEGLPVIRVGTSGPDEDMGCGAGCGFEEAAD